LIIRHERVCAIVLAAALACAATSLSFHWWPDHSNDVEILWHAGRMLLQGMDPYPLAPQFSRWPLYYPLPAVLLALPLTLLSFHGASVVWVGFIAGAFAWALSIRGRWALLALLSGASVHALANGQSTPLLVAAAILPGWGGLFTIKPNTGLAMFAAYPTKSAVIGSLVILIVSVAVLPAWPVEWLQTIRDAPHIVAPISRPFGWLLLLAGIRWRDPRARLLLALAIIPQNLLPHETVALALVPRNVLEMGIYVVGSWITLLAVSTHASGVAPADLHLLVEAVWPYMLACIYLPMLWLVLRSPRS
jgi:hypothetical protein